jgi:hypothetical protein
MIEVELPDGTIAEFPDGMSREQIQSALSKQFAPKAEPAIGGKAKSVGLSLARGLGSSGDFAGQLLGKVWPSFGQAHEAGRQYDDQQVAQAREKAGFTGMDASRMVGTMLSPGSLAAAGAFPGAGGGIAMSALRGAGQGAIFGGAQPVANPDDMAGEKLQQLTYGALGGAAGGAVGEGISRGIASRLAAREAAQTANATQDAAAQTARAAGYTIPPVTTNPTLLNRLTEGLAGKLTTAQQASMNNQSVTNALVRKALGMADDAPITKETLAALRKDAGAAYEAVASVPAPFVPDKPFSAAVARLRDQYTRTTQAFPSLANKDVSALLDDLSAEAFDPRVAVEVSKQLRFEASRNLGSPMASPGAVTLGRAQKEAAKELEDLIARNLQEAGMGDLHGAWQAARTQIAKIKNVERAVNDSTGNVIAGKLGQQLDRGSPLTAELRTVAQTSKAFPKATKEVTESMPGLSPLDYFFGIGAGTISGNPAAFLAPLARPVARNMILSPTYQRMFGSPSYSSGLLGQAGPLTPALTKALGAGGLLSYEMQ